MYTSKEINAEFQAAAMSQAAKARDIEVKTVTVTDSAEVAQAAESLDVDAYWVGNDNTVVSAIESVVQAAEQKGSLLFTSDADSASAAASLYRIKARRADREDRREDPEGRLRRPPWRSRSR